jgi:uncharacterized protein (TIGR00290 family)
MAVKPKALCAWSSGKDSAFALHEARTTDEVEVVGILTTVTAGYDRVSMHGVREQLLDRQAAALGLPCEKILIPTTCSNSEYEARMGESMKRARAQGVTHVVFGDLFLADVRQYRERMLAQVGLTPVFPLWQRDTRRLAREMIELGVRAHLVCVDPRKLDRGFAGCVFDRALLDALPAEVDPCGENGEFHTFVSAGPMFTAPIAIALGEVVERDGFVFADLLPAGEPAPQLRHA